MEGNFGRWELSARFQFASELAEEYNALTKRFRLRGLIFKLPNEKASYECQIELPQHLTDMPPRTWVS